MTESHHKHSAARIPVSGVLGDATRQRISAITAVSGQYPFLVRAVVSGRPTCTITRRHAPSRFGFFDV